MPLPDGSATSSTRACSPATSSTSTTAASSSSSAKTSKRRRPRPWTHGAAGCSWNGARSTRSRRNLNGRRSMSRVSKRYLAWAALGLLTGALAVAAAGCGGGGYRRKASGKDKEWGARPNRQGEGAVNPLRKAYHPASHVATQLEEHTGCQSYTQDSRALG